MGFDFYKLNSLVDMKPDHLEQLFRGIKSAVAARTLETTEQVLPALAEDPLFQKICSGDPYFLALAHQRVAFAPDEITSVLSHLAISAADSVREWGMAQLISLWHSEAEEADRANYTAAMPMDQASASKLLAFLASTERSYQDLFGCGLRRIEVSPMCIGSSSISSLPGYAIVSDFEAEGRISAAQENGLVHEAVHGVLFMAECVTGRQLVRRETTRLLRSPWSGNQIGVYQFAQAFVVWYVLLHYWSKRDPKSEHFARALSGFIAERTAGAVLDTTADLIDPQFFPVLKAMANRVEAARRSEHYW